MVRIVVCESSKQVPGFWDGDRVVLFVNLRLSYLQELG